MTDDQELRTPALDKGLETREFLALCGIAQTQKAICESLGRPPNPVFNALGRAAAVASCPYLERLAAQQSMELEEIRAKLCNLVETLSEFCGGQMRPGDGKQ